MIPFQLHRRIPLLRRPFFQRDQAIRERDAAVAERDGLRARIIETANNAATPVAHAAEVAPSVSYDFDADGMKLWDKNLSSLKSRRFVDAYARGIGDVANIQFRAYVCCWAAQHAANLPGDFVECGVNDGWLSLTICHYLDFNSLDKSFYLFDTYEGIPADQIMARERERAALHNYSECYERTKQKFAPFPKVKLVRGKVPDTLPTAKIDKVSYLSIDMNIAKPERDAIECFWPKLSSGGIVILDDYAFGGYEAQHETMDDFAAKVGTHILTLPTGQGIIIKN